MNSVLFTVAFLCLALFSNASNYYFSEYMGNDSRTVEQAQNTATPWKTIAKLNTVFSTLQPGDSVLFRRGENYDGSIIVNSSGAQQPIVIAAYGVGSNPVITGFTALSGWVSMGNGKWKATCANCQQLVNMLMVGETQFAPGRYPDITDANGGYLSVAAHVNNEKIIGTSLLTTDWLGGDIVIRKNRWIIDKHRITAQNGDTIAYNNADAFSYPPTDHYGYFIQNHPATLNKFGEWYYNADSKEIEVQLNATGTLPVVQVSTVDTLLIIHNQSKISISGITFRGSNLAAIDIENSNGTNISNCRFEYNGANAINAYLSNGLSVLEDTIVYSNNNALIANDCSNTLIKNNVIKRTGLLSGVGKNNDDTYQAIIVRGNNNLIALNKIDSTGYIPIRFEGNSVLVKNNFVSNFCMVKDDGGGIYTWHSLGDSTTNFNRTITGNIVINGLGSSSGTANPQYIPAAGIYCDGNAGNVNILNNTVANCSYSGIYFNNPYAMYVNGNTIYNNSNQLMISHENGNPESICNNNNFTNNTLVSKNTSQLVKIIESVHDDIYSLSHSDSNYYCRPLDDNFVISGNSILPGAFTNAGYKLEQWRNATQQDSFSRKSPMLIAPYTISSTNSTNAFSNGNFDSNIDDVYSWSPSGNSSLSWSNNGLTNGCLKLSFNSSASPAESNRNTYITFKINGVNTLKNYLLKFSLKACKNAKSFQVFLRKKEAPYNDLSQRYYCSINTNRTENQFAFIHPTTESEAYLVFEINEEDSTLLIDNLTLNMAELAITNPDDYLRFEYNETSTNKVVNLGTTNYLDMKGTAWQNSITLLPWSGIVLIKNTNILLPIEAINLKLTQAKNWFSLHWISSVACNKCVYYVEKQGSTEDFSTIYSLTASEKENVHPEYHFKDTVCRPGVYRYRIREVIEGGKIIVSNTVSWNVKSTGIMIYPNPARNKISIVAPNGLNENGYFTIVDLKGTEMQRTYYTSASTLVDVDVSFLPKGLYVVNLSNYQNFQTVLLDKY